MADVNLVQAQQFEKLKNIDVYGEIKSFLGLRMLFGKVIIENGV